MDPLSRAFQLASDKRTHPNPRVGAVLLKAGHVVGEGWHEGPGTREAAVLELERDGDAAGGATLFVTLEPCAHTGRTPPCSEAIVAAAVGKVVVGATDPDDRVSGKGIGALEGAGIDVQVSERPEDYEALDPGYFHHRRTGLPRAIAKWAMTLDGSVAAADHTSQWITSEEARVDAHRLRASVDAVVVGAGTLRSDDPRLDVRLDGFSGPQPRPVIVAGSKPLPDQSRIWERDPLVLSSRSLSTPSGENVVVPVSDVSGSDVPDPQACAESIAEQGLLDLLLEGGPTLLSAWWRAGLITEGYAYVGSKVGAGAGIQPIGGLFGTLGDAHSVEILDVQTIGPDVRIHFS